MVVVKCPTCEFRTEDHEPVIAAALLTVHGQSHAGAQALPAGQGPGPKLDRPSISAGSSTEDWNHFERNWENYKTVCKVTAAQVNTVLVECCEENLKHLMFGHYDSTQQAAASEADLLASIKSLAVVHERPVLKK